MSETTAVTFKGKIGQRARDTSTGQEGVIIGFGLLDASDKNAEIRFCHNDGTVKSRWVADRWVEVLPGSVDR